MKNNLPANQIIPSNYCNDITDFDNYEREPDMSCGRESTDLEKSFQPVFQAVRNLDKMLWFHGGEPKLKHGSRVGMVVESMKEVDELWEEFKHKLRGYKEDQFINKL